MNVVRRRRLMCLALSLVIGVLAIGSADAGFFGLGGQKKKSERVPRQSLVIFPFDQGAASTIPEGFGEFIASDVRSMLAGRSGYMAFLFKENLSPIKRFYGDVAPKKSEAGPPFAEDRAKALKLAQMLATDLFLVGAIDDFQVDRANKVAEMTLKADLYDGKTGKLVKTFLVTGRTPEPASTGEEDELRDLAKGAAVTKLIAEMTAPPPVAEKPAPAPASDKSAPPAPTADANKAPSPPPASAPPAPPAK